MSELEVADLVISELKKLSEKIDKVKHSRYYDGLTSFEELFQFQDICLERKDLILDALDAWRKSKEGK